jgi:hypothetical protein
MKCPKCQVEMRITRSRSIVENDDTPDTPTKLFVVQELTCLNKGCENYEKVVETSKNEIPLG